MTAIIDGVLNWFVDEYFSNEFSGGDALSLAVLVLLIFALSRRPSNVRTKDVLAIKGDVNQLKGQVQTLVAMLKPVLSDKAPSPPGPPQS